MNQIKNLHAKNIVAAGKNIQEAKKVLFMLHSRGANAQDILSLADFLNVADFALLAPQANNNTWYPYSFMAPVSHNEPWLSSSLALLKEILDDVLAQNITAENIYFLGFSQGACLTLEFVARNATKFGGVTAFTGGLLGDIINTKNYTGDFNGTPVFIGTSNPDPHVPVERVKASSNILRSMNAIVTEKIYDHMGHTISQNEINEANKLVFIS